MPPVINTGITVRITARKNGSRATCTPRPPPASQVRMPMAVPTKGKKHIIYFMFSFFQSTMGIGIFENMAKAALKLFHKLFMLPFLLYAI